MCGEQHIPERREIEALDPNNLLDRIEERLITSDQLKYKRLQFEEAKQQESKSLWEFENCLHYLQKQAKITENAQFLQNIQERDSQ